MGWIWAAVTVMTFVFVSFIQRWGRSKTKSRLLPPGPRGLPILGHLHMLGKNPHQELSKLARKHGPIMFLRLGLVPAIVVSSPQAAEQFLKTYDLVFASRPDHGVSKHLAYNQRNLSFGKYGPYWRNMRKLCILELLSNHKINSFQSMRREELALMIKSLKLAALDHGHAVNLTERISALSADISCLMVFGRKYMDQDIDKKGFMSVVREALKLAVAPNLGDFYPFLASFDLQGISRRSKALSQIFDDFFEYVIDEHVQDQDSKQTKDFVDTMMAILSDGEAEFQFDKRHVKAILLDLLIGAMDTSTSATEWVFSELLRHPQVMKKLQTEIDKIVGKNRMVEESDLDKLEYLNMIVKEAFRLHPVGPLLIPHEATEDCVVSGFHIPKKARILVNVWAIGRDPDAWSDPEKFMPERFLGSNIDLRGRNFELIPFGSGRRSCPGMQLGLTVVRLVVAQLVHCFDWELPDGILPSELDMTEEFGLVLSRVEPVMAIPTYRLQI